MLVRLIKVHLLRGQDAQAVVRQRILRIRLYVSSVNSCSLLGLIPAL
jgi:hypothetical protein